MVFQDSDVAKWIEAASYSLAVFNDPDLEKKIDEIVDIVAAAQDEDGYLDTRFTVSERERRWQNLLEGHEMYCAGHMMEAACAYFEVTGKRKLLDVMIKNAEHIYKRFVTDKTEGYPGCPEIELALMRLYRCSGNKHCLELAEHFIDCRGVDSHYYEKERATRNWQVWGLNPSDLNYQQSAMPVRMMTDAVGHAVRAAYLFTGMADVANETNDRELFDACTRLWKSMTEKRMYITGGIGSTYHGEAFTADYDLPSDTTYAETCASVALIFFAERMLENDVSGEYGDIMETAFYNTVLAGMQADGKRFFYVNPLEAIPGISGKIPTHRHALTTRPSWFACACCPPNAARLIASFGKYAYGENENTVFCNMFAAGNTEFDNGIKLVCETEYPYSGEIIYRVEGKGKIAVRIPSWSKSYSITKNGAAISPEIRKGYVYINISDGDVISLSLDMTPRIVYASQNVPALSGKAAVCAGPLVYCFEGVDNGGDVLSLFLDISEKPVFEEYDGSLLYGTCKITAKGFRREAQTELYSDRKPSLEATELHGIPYCLWANRGENQMRVWLPYIQGR
jgi:DUF1680 family protein